MEGLRRDELGFIRAHRYGRADAAQLEREFNMKKGERLYRTGNKNGVKRSEEVRTVTIEFRPGDTFSIGPRITKAAKERGALERALKTETDILKAAGLGSIPEPRLEKWGWSVRMKGFVLPGGTRTDAMICLPDNYPMTSPIGFYLKNGASIGGLDTEHLFEKKAYHGAKDLSGEGWAWFCGVTDSWEPGRHNLLSYVNAVMAFLTEKMEA